MLEDPPCQVCKMTADPQQQQPLNIVLSFPFPPKCFYEKLSEEEIVSMRPPEFPTESTEIKIKLFDTIQVHPTMLSERVL